MKTVHSRYRCWFLCGIGLGLLILLDVPPSSGSPIGQPQQDEDAYPKGSESSQDNSYTVNIEFVGGNQPKDNSSSKTLSYTLPLPPSKNVSELVLILPEFFRFVESIVDIMSRRPYPTYPVTSSQLQGYQESQYPPKVTTSSSGASGPSSPSYEYRRDPYFPYTYPQSLPQYPPQPYYNGPWSVPQFPILPSYGHMTSYDAIPRSYNQENPKPPTSSSASASYNLHPTPELNKYCVFQGISPLPDVNECRKYMICFPTLYNSFYAYVTQCPEDKAFSPEYRRCVQPYLVPKCDLKDTQPQPESKIHYAKGKVHATPYNNRPIQEVADDPNVDDPHLNRPVKDIHLNDQPLLPLEEPNDNKVLNHDNPGENEIQTETPLSIQNEPNITTTTNITRTTPSPDGARKPRENLFPVKILTPNDFTVSVDKDNKGMDIDDDDDLPEESSSPKPTSISTTTEIEEKDNEGIIITQDDDNDHTPSVTNNTTSMNMIQEEEEEEVQEGAAI